MSLTPIMLANLRIYVKLLHRLKVKHLRVYELFLDDL